MTHSHTNPPEATEPAPADPPGLKEEQPTLPGLEEVAQHGGDDDGETDREAAQGAAS